MYYVYILTNMNHTVLYTGVTNNLVRRLYEHQNLPGNSFVQKYRVFKLVYYTDFKNIDEAIAAEKQIKGWSRKKKNRLISTHNPEWKELFL